jgi:squalene-associated FAD-dependent desaturase
MKPGQARLDVGIIGAGWSGLAAAVELTQRGHRVSVYESARAAGGRARRVDAGGQALDNGQHLMIGAYAETLRLIETVRPGSTKTALVRLPLTLDYPGGPRLRVPRLPAPLHLAAALGLAQGFRPADKLAAIGFMRALQKIAYRPDPGLTVAEALARQPEVNRRYLWQPLCVAALNTPIEEASFAVFATVLRDALTGRAANSDFLIPATDLSALFPDPAMAWLEARGAALRLSHRVRAIMPVDGGWQVGLDGEAHRHDAVALATSPTQAAALLDPLPPCAAIAAQIRAIDYQPIETVYVAYPAALRLREPLLGWVDPVPLFLFDLGALQGRDGLIAAVASARGPHLDWDDGRWLDEIHRRVEQVLGPQPRARLIQRITEKRATFACTPSLQRPPAVTPCNGLWLAGDYVQGPYPATIEGAVRSGVQCALHLQTMP